MGKKNRNDRTKKDKPEFLTDNERFQRVAKLKFDFSMLDCDILDENISKIFGIIDTFNKTGIDINDAFYIKELDRIIDIKLSNKMTGDISIKLEIV